MLGGGHRKADEGIHIHAVCRAVECDGIAADDAISLQLVDAAGNGRAGQSYLLRDLLDRHTGVFGQQGQNFTVQIIHGTMSPLIFC